MFYILKPVFGGVKIKLFIKKNQLALEWTATAHPVVTDWWRG